MLDTKYKRTDRSSKDKSFLQDFSSIKIFSPFISTQGCDINMSFEWYVLILNVLPKDFIK